MISLDLYSRIINNALFLTTLVGFFFVFYFLIFVKKKPARNK